MARKGIGTSLIETIANSEAAELIGEYAELGIDAVTTDEVLKDIPVVGTLVKLAKISSTVRDYRFAKKLHRFLLALNEAPQSERAGFAEQVNDDPETKEKVGDILIAFIDNFDEAEKTEMLARVFIAFLRGEIPLPDLIRMGHTLERCLVSDLKQLAEIEKSTNVLGDAASDLVGSGLFENAALATIRASGAHNRYEITPFGERFKKVVLGPV